MADVCKFNQTGFENSSSTTGKGMKTIYVKNKTKHAEHKNVIWETPISVEIKKAGSFKSVYTCTEKG